MSSLAPDFQSLLRRAEKESAEEHAALVKEALEQTKDKTSPENRKSHWEYLIRNEVYAVAATEGEALKDPQTTYYTRLELLLHLALIFVENDVSEPSFALSVIQDLLEAQTIASCLRIFTWIEAHATRLTVNMVEIKGKSLPLLRALNDLLRRVSKTGNTTMFCGRILLFLSAVVDLNDRSGVNLRGAYGSTWEGVRPRPISEKAKGEGEEPMQVQETKTKSEETNIKSEKDVKDEKDNGAEEGEDVKMEDTESKDAKSEEEKREDFYQLFWSLQTPFAQPIVFSQPNTMADFKKAVDGVLPVLKEANTKERIMMGSKAVAGTKRKRDVASKVPIQTAEKNYFFAKFLTSPELLDLEIADTHFRRQILFQLLIVLTHLQTFTVAEKEKWENSRNRGLQMSFTLEGDDATWVEETIAKALEELRQTSPSGKAFGDAAAVIIEREKSWIRWKGDLCPPFDRPPLKESLWETTAPKRQKMRENPPPFEHSHGSAKLSELWEEGYRDLGDLERYVSSADLSTYVRLCQQEEKKIEMRKKQLAQARARQAAAAAAAVKEPSPGPSPTPTPKDGDTTATSQEKSKAGSSLHPSLPPKPGSVPPSTSPAPPSTTPGAGSKANGKPAAPTDPMIARFEEAKQRYNWLGIRAARDTHLQYYGQIGNGDVLLLQEAMEKEKEKERAEAEAANARLESEEAEKKAVLTEDDDEVKREPEEQEEGARSQAVQPAESGDVAMAAAEDVKDGKTDASGAAVSQPAMDVDTS